MGKEGRSGEEGLGKVFYRMSRGEKMVDSGRDGHKLGDYREKGKVRNCIIEWGERLVGIDVARPQAES